MESVYIWRRGQVLLPQSNQLHSWCVGSFSARRLDAFEAIWGKVGVLAFSFLLNKLRLYVIRNTIRMYMSIMYSTIIAETFCILQNQTINTLPLLCPQFLYKFSINAKLVIPNFIKNYALEWEYKHESQKYVSYMIHFIRRTGDVWWEARQITQKNVVRNFPWHYYLLMRNQFQFARLQYLHRDLVLL